MRKRTVSKLISLIMIISLIVTLASFSSSADSGDQKWNLGSTTNTGKDNGYSGSNTIDKDDPHYGWTLGQFFVSGYTQRTSDSQNEDVFLKNVGDQVALHFELLQNLDSLNSNENLSVYADENGYDQYFGTQQFNDCRGLLIIRKTDYQNKTEDPVIYTNYLDGVVQGADTVVELCEEGDYEVALDYEIKEDHYGVDWNTYLSIPTYTNYRIFFKFKIRNGNCMVFPFDTKTGSELTNESFTDNGFYLDLANSRYLDINVKRTVYVEGANGYSEDVRFNKPAADGTQYTDEGVYTITVKNNFTNQETVKVIYVGTDPVMRAFAVSGYSLDEIQNMLEDGYQINDKGNLVSPDGVVPESDKTDETETSEGSVDTTPSDGTSSGSSHGNAAIWIVVIVVLGVAITVVVFLILCKKRKSQISEKPIQTPETNNEAELPPEENNSTDTSASEEPVDESEDLTKEGE